MTFTKTCFLFLVVIISAWSFTPFSESPDSTKEQTNEYENVLEQFGLSSRMTHYGVPGISFAVIKNGKLDWTKGYGLLQAGNSEKVDTETLFSVGSISKVGTAMISLKLREGGKLNVDENVNQYLKSWQIPKNQYTQKQPVTLRHIMSHTAGLTVHGFADFYPGENLPNTVQILNGERPAKNNPVIVNIPVGSKFRYSGGGTTVQQMVIEDCTGLPFYKAADSLLFQPLKMKRSSYQNPLSEDISNIAKAHNRDGRTVALPRGFQSMPEAAASGLWTTPSDFSKVMIVLMEAYQGKSSYLSQDIVKDMLTPVSPSTYGLGPRIKELNNDIQFYHGGANDSYRARFIGMVNKQNGIIVFTNGTSGSDLIDEILPVFDPLLFTD